MPDADDASEGRSPDPLPPPEPAERRPPLRPNRGFADLLSRLAGPRCAICGSPPWLQCVECYYKKGS